MLRRNVLIFHSGALGDFVLSWPLALALGRIYAQSRIFYVTAGQKGALAERALRIESSDVEAGWHSLFSGEPSPPANVTRSLEGAHAVFSFVASDNSIWATNLKRLSPHARMFFIDPNPPMGFDRHASQLLLDQVAGDPVVSTAVSQMLKSIQDRGIGASRPADGPIVLHPGAGADKKRWPLESYVALAAKLREAGRTVHVVFGEVETERWTPAEQTAFDGVATIVKPKTLVELFAVLMQAAAVIGNDSGPIHLAGIIGAPAIALFGPTDPRVWRPLGPKVQVIKGDSMGEISVSQVFPLLNSSTIAERTEP